jgi:hypothetical protein
MTLFNDKLKNITLKEVLILIIILFLIQSSFNFLNIFHFDTIWIYIFIIFYFIFKLRDDIFSIKDDIREIFSKKIIKTILLIVVLNIFFSYGMLYFSDFILKTVSSLNTSNSILNLTVLTTIIVSPISEELIFRGVFLNRLRLVIPTLFAVLISSLLFASLHSFGSIFSAFVFAVCISILYLKTENILVPIMAHFLNNLFAEIIVFMDYNKVLFTNNSVILIMSVLAVISFIIILISIIPELKKIK